MQKEPVPCLWCRGEEPACPRAMKPKAQETLPRWLSVPFGSR
jgi:hypothetical protein